MKVTRRQLRNLILEITRGGMSDPAMKKLRAEGAWTALTKSELEKACKKVNCPEEKIKDAAGASGPKSVKPETLKRVVLGLLKAEADECTIKKVPGPGLMYVGWKK